MIENILTNEQTINVTVALSVQSGLVNEVYPEIRAIQVFIDHKEKLVTVLFVYYGEYLEKLSDSMESVDSTISSSLGGIYNCNVCHINMPLSKWFEVRVTSQIYSFTAYQMHQDFNYDEVDIMNIGLSEHCKLWGE